MCHSAYCSIVLQRRSSPSLYFLFLVAQIVAGYSRALQTALDACDALAEKIDVDNGPQLKKLVDAAVGTKFSSRWEEGDVLSWPLMNFKRAKIKSRSCRGGRYGFGVDLCLYPSRDFEYDWPQSRRGSPCHVMSCHVGAAHCKTTSLLSVHWIRFCGSTQVCAVYSEIYLIPPSPQRLQGKCASFRLQLYLTCLFLLL